MTTQPTIYDLEVLYSDQDYKNMLIAKAYSYCKDAEIAKDMVQDTFVKVCSKIRTVKTAKALRSFTYQTLVNTAKDWIKANRVRRDYHYYVTNSSRSEEDNSSVQMFEIEQVFEHIDRLELFNNLEKQIFQLWKKAYRNREIAEVLEEVPNALTVARAKENMIHKPRRYRKVLYPNKFSN